jgi:parallel beta-helix repeat protein
MMRWFAPHTHVVSSTPQSTAQCWRHFSLLASLGLTTIPFVGLSASANPLLPTGDRLAQADLQSVNWLYVNPESGDDRRGSGSALAPFQTITHALSIAQPDTVILLAPGTYSSAETFPLQLKPGVTIQGDASTRGEKIIISGGGSITTPSSVRANITILTAEDSGLIGVTVTNPNPQGYGVWVDSSSPVLLNNTFKGSTQDGMSIDGSGAPVVRGNHFIGNRQNGITIYGTSQAEIRENVFERMKVGIYIAQNAAPRIVNNRITNNKDGVVVQQNSTPILRGNTIAENDDNGAIVLANAQPDLGTADDPGENTFRKNGDRDLHNATQSFVISAMGNQISPDRTEGRIHFEDAIANTPEPVAEPVAEPILSQAPAPVREFGQALDSSPRTRLASASFSNESVRNESAAPASRPVDSPNPQTRRSFERIPAPNADPAIVVSSRGDTPNFALEPTGTENLDRLSSDIPLPEPPDAPTVAKLPISPEFRNELPDAAVEFVLPNAEPTRVTLRDRRSSVADVVPELGALPVPAEEIPFGDGGESNIALRPPSVTASMSPLATTTPLVQLIPRRTAELRYRVIVQTTDVRERALVKTLVPDAFSTIVSGQEVLQAGAFSELDRANSLLAELQDYGLIAKIEEIEN